MIRLKESNAKCKIRLIESNINCKIRLIESNAKCRYLKKFTCKRTLRQVFMCLKPPPRLCFCLVQVQVQVLNLVRNRVLNSCRIWPLTQLNIPPSHPLPASHYLHILYFDFWKGGGLEEVNQREG
jgi:hypothetical protein